MVTFFQDCIYDVRLCLTQQQSDRGFLINHFVLKLSICTLASPWQQRSDWGLRVTQNAYFSLMTHTKQLLLVTILLYYCRNKSKFSDTRTDAHTEEEEGQTDVEVEIFI